MAVKGLVTLSEETNRVLNVVKAKYGLRTKSDAVDRVVQEYARELLEPELRPEYVRKLRRLRRQRAVRVPDFGKRYDSE